MSRKKLIETPDGPIRTGRQTQKERKEQKLGQLADAVIRRTITRPRHVNPESRTLWQIEQARRDANEAVLHSKAFLNACEVAGIHPTPRQASKFNNQYGKAYEAHRKLVKEASWQTQ